MRSFNFDLLGGHGPGGLIHDQYLADWPSPYLGFIEMAGYGFVEHGDVAGAGLADRNPTARVSPVAPAKY